MRIRFVFTATYAAVARVHRSSAARRAAFCASTVGSASMPLALPQDFADVFLGRDMVPRTPLDLTQPLPPGPLRCVSGVLTVSGVFTRLTRVIGSRPSMVDACRVAPSAAA